MRLLDGGDALLKLEIGSNNIRAHVGGFYFHLQTGGWPLPGLPPCPAEEPGQNADGKL